MESTGRHTIQKLTIDVTASSVQQGYSLKDNVRSFIDRYVVPAVEQYLAALEQYVSPGEVIRIDNLQIELKADRAELETAELSFALQQAFGKSLEGTATQLQAQEALTERLKEQRASSEKAEEQPLQKISVKEHRLKTLIYFLKHGSRPWWSHDVAELNALLEESSLLQLIDEERTAFVQLLQPALLDPTVRKRLIRQFSDAFIAQLSVRMESARKNTALKKKLQALAATWPSVTGAPSGRERWWQLVFRMLVLQSKALPVNETLLRQELRTAVGMAEPITAKQRKVLAKALETMHVLLGKPQPELPGAEWFAEVEKTAATKEVNPEAATRSAAEKAAEVVVTKKAEELLKAMDKKQAETVEEQEHLYVENAGLVILHPFLKTLFESVGLWTEGTFTDPALAVHVLHYLATGIEQDWEHAMQLEKFLVGLPPEESIEKDIVLSDAIKAEVEDIMNALREYWPAMERTSNEAFREGFLQRKGKLIMEEPNARLVVERQALDILLDKLPWATSIVRLPWMDELLYVEW